MRRIIIVSVCAVLLVAYLFEVSSSKTKIPSVIFLLFLGWLARQVIEMLGIHLPELSFILPFLGTIGLVLIVLEGALELEFDKSKFALIKKSFIGAFFTIAALSTLLAALFDYFGSYGFKNSFINAIPFCVISSAIAIPSARGLATKNKEYVIYESSLSDILGVLIFNFFVFNEAVSVYSLGNFTLEIFIISIISFLATVLLSYLLYKIEYHIKFFPIILLVVMIYTISRIYELPGLVFILLFGLFIGNVRKIKGFKWIEKFRLEELGKEVQKFKELNIEVTFLVRSLFFLLFGYLIETRELLDMTTFYWAASIVGLIFIFRIIQLKWSKLPLRPLLFMAPRGLITTQLFLSIIPAQRIPIVNKSLIIQVIILTSLVMMIGLITNRSKQDIP